MSELADITVHVASFNSRSATELTIRSALRLAGRPFRLVVGDSGSTDGSREMLEQFAARRWLELEVSDSPCLHADWLDHWIASCPTSLAVFIDSDIEFLRARWLDHLTDPAKRYGADLVYAESLPGASSFVIPRSGERVTLAPRPAPWLFLVRTERARAVGTSFHEYTIRGDPPLPTTYDVGGWFFRNADEQGLRWVVLPRSIRAYYHHFGGRSWRFSGAGAEGKLRRDELLIEMRLQRARALDNGNQRQAKWLGWRSRGLRIAWELARIARLSLSPRRIASRIQRMRDQRANRAVS